MEDQQRLAVLYQLRDELVQKTPDRGVEEYSKTLATLTDGIDRLKEKIGPAQEPLVITTSQWLGAISFVFSVAAVYYKHKERKKLFEGPF